MEVLRFDNLLELASIVCLSFEKPISKIIDIIDENDTLEFSYIMDELIKGMRVINTSFQNYLKG